MAKPLLKFYLSCILSSWGDRIWFFALSIYFVTINKDSLLMTAISGLTCNIFSILLGPILGGLVDKHQRIKVVRYSLFLQNFTVALNCGVVVLIMVFREFIDGIWNGWFLYLTQVGIILLNVISNLSSTTTKIAIERDWVVVIAEYLSQDSSEEDAKSKNLALINSTVRRIDLTTNIVAPLVAGLIMSFFNMEKSVSSKLNGTVLSAICFAVWNIFSYIAEYSLLSNVYTNIPALKKTKLARKIEKKKSNILKKIRNSFVFTKKGWKIYFKQGPILMPSLAFALLFLTVLSFDSITIGYAKYQKLKEFTISIFQGVGSLAGVLGTIAFPILHNRLKMRLQIVGIIGNIFQIIFLFGCLASIFLPGTRFRPVAQFFENQTETCENKTENSTTSFWSWYTFVESECHVYISILVLLGCMALSRFGLWLSDLVINQIFQENIKENERGVVGGVQSSINMVFDLLKYTSVILLSDLQNYGYLVIMSVSALFLSFCLFTTYAVLTLCRKKEETVEMKELKIRKSMIQFSPNNDNQEESDSFDEEPETQKLNTHN